jgi:hypothetical protein
MGEGKRVRAKQVGKHELEKDWELSNYIPEVGEAVYYDPEIDEDGNPDASKAVEGRAPITHTRQKIGDGINRVADLPFVGSGNTNLLSNDINSIIQTGNSAYDKNSVVLGNDNQSYAEHAFIEGSLNLSGVRLIDGFNLDITSAAIWTDENGTRYTKIVLNTLPDNLDFIEDPAIVIFANDNYYSCRFFKIEDNTLYFANHNAAGAIKTNITNNLVD